MLSSNVISSVLLKLKNSNIKDIEIKINGNSMFPTLKHQDVVKISLSKKNYKIGDIVCYIRNNEFLIIHRIIKVKNVNGEYMYELRGDNLDYSDMELVSEKNILGIYEEKKSFKHIVYYKPINSQVQYIIEDNYVNELFKRIAPLNKNKKNCKNLYTVYCYKEFDNYYIHIYNKQEEIKKFIYKEIDDVIGILYSILYNSDEINNLYNDIFLGIHSGVVKYKNNLIFVCGESGSGKTTLVEYLVKNGFEYCGDEKVYVDEGYNNIKIYPYYTPLASRKYIEDSIPINVKKNIGNEKKFLIPVKNRFTKQININKVIVIVPKWGKENNFEVKKLNKLEAIDHLMKNIFISDKKINIYKIFKLVNYCDIISIQYCEVINVYNYLINNYLEVSNEN